MKKKFKIETLGCKINQYESQAFSDQLKGLGLICANDANDVDICIVNACSVTNSADRKSFEALKSLKKKHPNAKFYLTGCLSKKIDKIQGDVQIVPNKQKHELVSHIFPERVVPKFQIKNFEGHTRAFVKIQDGCSSGCSYCVIPSTRGASRSRNPTEILSEITQLVDNGYKEIVLTGINISDYKSDISFEKLLLEINKIQNLQRIKISSIDPIGVSDELIDILINSDKMAKTLHMVLQSGSNRILKKMNRKYTTDLFLKKFQKINALNSDFTFTTDVIVGFPSETDEDFQNTLKIINEVKFSKVHIFPYSKRPNTLAASFLDQVDQKIIDQRVNYLTQETSNISIQRHKVFLEREMDVLFENIKDDFFFGHTQNNLLVYVPKSDEILRNSIRKVKLTENRADYILGELCK